MTAIIIPFVPRTLRPVLTTSAAPEDLKKSRIETAQSNMADFIDHAKSNARFLTETFNCAWDDQEWKFGVGRGKTTRESCNFSQEAYTDIAFDEPFGSQARAVIANIYTRNERSEPVKLIRVIRLLYKLMSDLELKPDLTLLEQYVVDQMNEIIRKESSSSHWNLGRKLNLIINSVLNKHFLTAYPVYYQSPFKFKDTVKRDDYLSSSHRADLRPEQTKSKKLPDLQAILDIAALFNRNTGPLQHYNSVFTSFAAIAMFAPSRQAEIVTLPIDCITFADDERSKRERLGLRWRPAKGGTPLTKFSTTHEWESIATDAVERLVKLGRYPRAAAAWYELNPDKLYLPPGLEYLRGQPLTWLDIADIIGWEPVNEPTFRQLRLMERALEEVGVTDDDSRIEIQKESVREVGHAVTYTYDSVIQTVMNRISVKNIRVGPNILRARAWFEKNPDKLLCKHSA